MIDYLTADYTGGPFELFSGSHLLTIVVLTLVGVMIIAVARAGDESTRRRLRVGLAVILLMTELSWHIWSLVYGRWRIEEGLPLHLCSIMMWVTAVVLIWQKRSLYPLVYFLGIAGATQGLLTPDVGIYGFPHFRFLQIMIGHGGLVIAGLWVVTVENCRPDRRSLLSLFAGLNVYAFFVWLINLAIGSNYLFVSAKPETASLLDLFPGWPWYILGMEGFALIFFGLLYLPFRNPRTRPAPTQ